MKLALALTLLAGWQPAQPVKDLAGVRASVGADGTVHAATTALDGPLAVRSAPPGGAFGPPRTLAEGPGNLWNDVDASGAATVFFEQRDPGDPGPAYGTHPAHGLSAAVAAPAQPLGPATLISTPGRRTIAWGLDVAESGAAVAAWLEEDGGRWYVTAALRPRGAAAFGAPQRVSPRAVLQREVVDVAVGEAGDALVLWHSRAYGTTGAYVALARPSGEFVDSETLSRRAGRVAMAVGPAGQALIAVEDRHTFHVRTFGAGAGTLLRPFRTLACQRVEGATIGTDGQMLLACGHGDALWAWEGYGFLSRTERLSTRRHQVDSPVDVALGRRGRALVAFEERATPGRTVLKAALRDSGPIGSTRPQASFRVTPLTGRSRGVAPMAALLLPAGGALVLGAEDYGGTFSVRYTP